MLKQVTLAAKATMFGVALTLCVVLSATRSHASELVVLVPMMAGNQPVMRAAPQGQAQAPILKRAPTDAITKSIAAEATRGATKFMLALDEQAQRVAGVTSPKPTYLLRSQEEGGFAKVGFWLADANNNVVWRNDPYVDLVMDRQSIDDGSFEEVFAHEMGHVLLRRLLPKLPNGMSRVPHSSLAVTDYPTAFDEGFAIHFQGLARHLTENANLKAVDAGLEYKPFLPYWQSNLDRSMRLRGMRENLFIHRQLPTTLQVGDASALFDLSHFKNGQQMLASEGVIATLFYHLQLAPNNSPEVLSDRYRSVLISLRTLNTQRLTSSTPLFLNLMRIHTERLPSLKSRWFGTFLNLTYGATASDAVLRDLTKLSVLGQEGAPQEFAAALKQSRAALATLTTQVTRSPQRLSAALGPELWLAFKQDEDDVMTINLNTAEKASLMEALGIESDEANLLLTNRTAQGMFQSIDDFAVRREASELLRRRLEEASRLAAEIGGFTRR